MLNYYTTGIVIDTELPFLGAFPDCFVECDCCEKRCIEIKCPYTHADKCAQQAACLDSKNFETVQGVPKLIKSEKSPYFCQIQCQLAVTMRKYCDLIIFTYSGIFVQRVDFDACLWHRMKQKLVEFYIKYIHPRLLKINAM